MLRIGDMMDGLFEPAVLVWGESDDLLRFGQTLHDLRPDQEALCLTDLEYCRSVDGTVLSVAVKADGRGLTWQTASIYLWEIRPDDLPRFVDMVVALAAVEGSGHQCLESGAVAESQIVIVSKGEYPNDFLMPEA